MGNLTKIIMLLALLLSCDHTKVSNTIPSQMPNDSTGYIYEIPAIQLKTIGPESFPFCGGQVSLWLQVESLSNIKLFLKVSPPKEDTWEFWNAHIIIESPNGKNDTIRFSDDIFYNSTKTKNRVISSGLNTSPSEAIKGLKIALKPFKGCSTKQEIKGIFLKP